MRLGVHYKLGQAWARYVSRMYVLYVCMYGKDRGVAWLCRLSFGQHITNLRDHRGNMKMRS